MVEDNLIDIAKANMQLSFVKEASNLESVVQSKIVTLPKKTTSCNFQGEPLLSDWF